MSLYRWTDEFNLLWAINSTVCEGWKATKPDIFPQTAPEHC